MRTLIKKTLCIGYCHRQLDAWDDGRRFVPKCKEVWVGQPYAWCEGCMRDILHRAVKSGQGR